MAICWVPVRTLVRRSLWMIKGSVPIKSHSPQEARWGINKPHNPGPFSTLFGRIWSVNWFDSVSHGGRAGVKRWHRRQSRRGRKFETPNKTAPHFTFANPFLKPVGKIHLCPAFAGFSFYFQGSLATGCLCLLPSSVALRVHVLRDGCQMTNQHLKEAYTNGEACWCPLTDIPKHSALISSRLGK